MSTLKTLSLEDFRSDDAATRAKFCEDLLWCFSEQGFVHIRDHGLSAEFVAEGFRYVSTPVPLPVPMTHEDAGSFA